MSSAKKTIRAAFRVAVFSRDGHACRICGAKGSLDAHHITDRSEMPNGGYVAENGISLCPQHHEDAEEWHRSGKTNHVKGMMPFDLYKLIGSSHEAAVKASEKLS